MKIIFVASGNQTGRNVTSFVRSQYESLQAESLDMHLFPVYGHGIKAYLMAAYRLRKYIRKTSPDLIHAHYSLCGYVAKLACVGLWRKPKIVVSILGSFPTRNKKWRLVRYCVKNLWDATIVKSNRTAAQLDLPVHVIPNGVNLDIFHLMEYTDARKRVGFETDKKYVIWCSNPQRKEKNWGLAERAVESLKRKVEGVELVAVYDKTPVEVCTYMNAADCLLLTSDSEGSPNVIKEAMACNCPIVTTDVGDVRERLANLDGCYVVEEPMAIDAEHLDAARLDSKNFDAGHTDAMRLEKTRRVSAALEKALEFGKRTEGRQRILEDGLTIEQTAKKIIKLYERI